MKNAIKTGSSSPASATPVSRGRGLGARVANAFKGSRVAATATAQRRNTKAFGGKIADIYKRRTGSK